MPDKPKRGGGTIKQQPGRDANGRLTAEQIRKHNIAAQDGMDVRRRRRNPKADSIVTQGYIHSKRKTGPQKY